MCINVKSIMLHIKYWEVMINQELMGEIFNVLVGNSKD